MDMGDESDLLRHVTSKLHNQMMTLPLVSIKRWMINAIVTEDNTEPPKKHNSKFVKDMQDPKKPDQEKDQNANYNSSSFGVIVDREDLHEMHEKAEKEYEAARRASRMMSRSEMKQDRYLFTHN